MMSSLAEQAEVNTDGVAGQLPMRKRKKPDDEAAHETITKPTTTEAGIESEHDEPATKFIKKSPANVKQKEIRLEQNRKAARESRRRKKVMIEELQRSVIFFSRANGTLKHQNDDLARLLMQAQAQVVAIESQAAQAAQAPPPQPQAPLVKTEAPHVKPEPEPQSRGFQQAQAQTVATQAVYESQGFPAAAARAAAQTMNAGPTSTQPMQNAAAPTSSQQLPPMQPGATMQAMANFQQAAAAAMQSAMHGMQGSIPGVSLNSLAATPSGTNPQQAYNDTMTALAMQQAAAAAAAGQQFFQNNPFMAHQMLAWQQSSAAAQAGQQQGATQAQPPAQAPSAPPQPSS
jgi:hypothetical protein